MLSVILEAKYGTLVPPAIEATCDLSSKADDVAEDDDLEPVGTGTGAAAGRLTVVASSESFQGDRRGVKRVGCDMCPSDVSASSCLSEDDDDLSEREVKSDEDDLDVDADEHDAKRPRRDAGDVKDAAEILASIFVKVPASPPASPTFHVVEPAAEMPPAHQVEPGTGTTCLDRLQSLGESKISRLRAHGVRRGRER